MERVTGAIQPEVLYELLLLVRGPASPRADSAYLGLWRVLSTTVDPMRPEGARLAPTPVHRAMVEHAWRTGHPIFTTNFDTLFEDAAVELGLPDPWPILPWTADQGAVIRRIAAGKPLARPTIFKLHGSVDHPRPGDLHTLATTMHSITRVNYEALKCLAVLGDRSHAVLVGYSGRDIDLFPEIVALGLRRPPFWISPTPGGDVGERRAWLGARHVQMTADEALTGGSPAGASPGAMGPLLDRLEREVEESAPWSPRQALLLLGLCLKEIGLFRHSGAVLEELGRSEAFSRERDSHLWCLLHLNLGRLAHERSCYVTTSREARQVLGAVPPGGDSGAFRVMALGLEAESMRMRVPHNLGLPRDTNLLDALPVLARFVVNAARMLPLLWRGRREAGVPWVMARHEVLEHLVRMGALVQRGTRRVIERGVPVASGALRWVMTLYWEALAAASKRLGYSHGIANSGRYLKQLDRGPAREAPPGRPPAGRRWRALLADVLGRMGRLPASEEP